ncbi:MAG: TolC family protein [Bdellovibrionales bacterium]|nr:TolC family protein [Bdellovibrionales bacterium]
MRILSQNDYLTRCLILISTFVFNIAQTHAAQEDVNQKSGNVVQDSLTEKERSNDLLQEYVSEAVSSNSGLKASFEVYRAAKQDIRSIGTLPDPKFTYANFIRSVETRVGPQEHKFGITQAFPWFGTLSLKSEIADDGARSLLYRFEAERLSLIQKVKHTFYDGYYLDRSINIIHQNLELISNLERVTRSRYRTGVGQFSDVIRSQVELEKLKDQLTTTRDLKIPLAERFKALLNRPSKEAIIWPTTIPTPREKGNISRVKELLAQYNPQVKSLDALAEREQKNIRLAKKDGLPSFMLGFDYIVTGKAQAPIVDSGKDPIAAMITLDIPLWRGKYSAQVSEAKSNELAARKMREETLNQLYAELSQAVYEYSDAIRKIDLYQTNLIPKGKQSFEATKRGYEAGKASFSDLIDSERLLLEFQLAHEEALTKANKAKASIDMLVGVSSGADSKYQEKKQ